MALRSPLHNKGCMTPLPSSTLVVGNAVAATAFDSLRKSGITCVLNCTVDLIEPSRAELGADIQWHRIPLADDEDQDITGAIDEAISIIDRVGAAGGKTLVHCHEGRSRSVALCLAYFMVKERMPLADALNFIKSNRPEARPNAGFMRQLMALEQSVLGSSSMQLKQLPKGKPKCLKCDICGQSVGLQSALASHLKLKHGMDAKSVKESGARAIVEKELTTLLQRFNPAKVANIPNLLDKYAGREQELLDQAYAKYASAGS